ncbi:MAG: hypothetical protein IPN01_24255 [Deltaproteobacteria bacterium]|nr:hypothetical protein [Deltaproteobacteria bacterium]
MRLTGFNSPISLALLAAPLRSVAASIGLCALIACGGVGFDPLEDGTTGDSTTAEETGGWRPGQGKDSEPPDTGPINPIPQLSRFAAHEDGDKVRFFFTLDDEDDNMTGGSVTLRFDAIASQTYAYPDQVGGSGKSRSLTWAVELFAVDTPHLGFLQAVDSVGNASGETSAVFIRPTWRAATTETGDTFGKAGSVGAVNLPGLITGELSAASNNGSDYTGDVDFVRFTVPQSGERTLLLTWDDPSADFDLFLMSAGPTDLVSSATTAFPSGSSFALTGNVEYTVAIAGWAGGAAWNLRIE